MPAIPKPLKNQTLRVSEVAELIGCTPTYVRLLIHTGKLPSEKIDTTTHPFYEYRISRADVETFKAQRIKPRGVKRGSKLPTGWKRKTGKNTADHSYYVYGWYEGDSPIPFYVGMGIKDRAEQVHTDYDEVKSRCQVVRERAENFKIMVFKRGLDERDARMIEAVLIRAFKSAGGCQTNVGAAAGGIREYVFSRGF